MENWFSFTNETEMGGNSKQTFSINSFISSKDWGEFSGTTTR
ncbi:hypothetical protein [Chitinophaga sp. LS1]|nr:hypothetical protein [Chitinophaga sp. LS1]WPV67035.1 hypothetical protein QQL36_35170 [Chitinophaga sp. LS1]